jgi:hypothetical protein
MDGNPPYNWCDRECERCPLEATCELARRLRAAPPGPRERGENEDDLEARVAAERSGAKRAVPEEAVIAALKDDLAHMIERLEDTAVEDEPDSTAAMSPLPLVLLAKKLNALGMDYVRRVAAIRPQGAAIELRACALLTAMKLARLAGHLELRSDLEFDVAPNRLLLERVGEKARRALDELRLARAAPSDALDGCDRIAREIDRLLELAFGPIPARVRAELDRRIAQGQAPSPFCVRSGPSTAA